MTTIEDLHLKSISEMSSDEAIEYLRQIRLARRTPVKTKKASNAIKKSQKKKAMPKITANDAAELLKLLGGN